jgi:hypothetical protein
MCLQFLSSSQKGQRWLGQKSENNLYIHEAEGSLEARKHLHPATGPVDVNMIYFKRASSRVVERLRFVWYCLTSSGMIDPRIILALCVACDIDQREADRLRRLRERLFEECKRVERARLLRMRHYQTAQALPSPSLSPGMFVWYFSTDTNVINTTGLCR